MNKRWGTMFFFAFVILTFGFITSLDAQSKYWRERFESVGYNVAINPHNPNTIYAENRGGLLNISRDKGKSWTAVNPVPGPFRGFRNILIHPKDTLTIFILRDQGGMWKTVNEGQTWYDVIPGFGIDGESISFDPQHPDTMYAGDFFTTKIYRSTDRGDTWVTQSTLGTMVCGLTVRPDSGNIILAGTGNGSLGKSTDEGMTWTQVYNAGTSEVPKIVFNPTNPLIGYATVFVDNPPETGCGLIKTTNGGNTWFQTPILKDTSCWSIVLDEAHPETVYVGRWSNTGYGIEQTPDGGATYHHFQDGLQNSPGDPPFAPWNLKISTMAPHDVWLAGTINSFGPGAVYHFVDTSTTIVQGTVRSAVTNNPVSATVSIATTFETKNVSGSYSFKYYNDDPSLTPTVHVTSPGYYAKDTTLTFVFNTTQNADIHLTPLPPSSINGQVFNDLNDNGIKDAGEPGLANWRVKLSGAATASVLTDANGRYSFGSLLSGTYTVSESLQAGWISRLPFCGMYTISFNSGLSQNDVDFGNEILAPGVTLMSEDFTTTTFPPPCWGIVDVNSVFTWFRATTVVHSAPAAARDGSGILGDGKPDDWLYFGPIRLQAGRLYRLSWWDRTFTSGGFLDSLTVTVGLNPPVSTSQIINDRGFLTSLTNDAVGENVQQDFNVSADSLYYISFHDHSAAGNTMRIDDVMLKFLHDTFHIDGTKYRDTQNDSAVIGDPAIDGWVIKLYKAGVLQSRTVTSGGGHYSFIGLDAGTYTVEESLQVGWTQTVPRVTDPGVTATTYGPNAGPRAYTVTVGPASETGKNFGNFHPNSLTVNKFEDDDGNFNTSGDRVAKNWHLEVHKNTVNGPLIAVGDAPSITAPDLVDGTYYVVEADSSGWVHLGNVVDGVPSAISDNFTLVLLSNGQNRTVDFVNAPPAYGQMYRTAKYEDWATATDRFGKPKAAKRKADKVFFRRNIGVPASVTGFTLSFNVFSRGKVYTSKAKVDTLVPTSPWDSVKQVIYIASLNSGDSLQVEGRGLSGKLFEFSVVWTTTSSTTITVKYKKDTPGWKKNTLGLPMPNLINVGEELFPRGFGQITTYYTATNPLIVGKQTGGDNPNTVKHLKYADVLKTLIKRASSGILLHTEGARCLRYYDIGGSPGISDVTKPIKKQPTGLPPGKHNNRLLAEVLALKLNVAASITGKFPGGLGELTYFDNSQPTNKLNGQIIDTILVKADKVLACIPENTKPGGALTPQEVFAVVRAIDSVFAGPVDTNSFATKIALPGTKRLYEVSILHPTPGLTPKTFFSPPVGDNVPLAYTLRQNYPNPFNPTTTIEFELLNPAVVTMKIYNVLGQEVGTLLNRETMEDGSQEVEFDASKLSSGVYFYRIIVEPIADEDGTISGETFTSVKKMLLLK